MIKMQRSDPAHIPRPLFAQRPAQTEIRPCGIGLLCILILGPLIIRVRFALETNAALDRWLLHSFGLMYRTYIGRNNKGRPVIFSGVPTVYRAHGESANCQLPSYLWCFDVSMCRLIVQQAPAIYSCGLWRRWGIKRRMCPSALHIFACGYNITIS